MNSRLRFIPPLAAALLLGAALALHFFWPAPEVEPQVETPPPVKVQKAVVLAPVAPVATPARPRPVPVVAPVVVAEEPPELEEPLEPVEAVPEPEVARSPPEEDAPTEPVKPQKAAWKHGQVLY